MQLSKEEAAVEAILFACGEPADIRSIAEAIGEDTAKCKKLIDGLSEKYISEKRGIKIIELENSYQMCTNPDFFDEIKNVCAVERKKTLSPTLLETLAIIAYKQPITKGQIEAIRGVNADHAVNSLVKLGLVCEKGRLDAPGRPILFATTDEFLRFFGISGLGELPDMNKPTEEEKNNTSGGQV
ncbi:MAG: SMC-Scp complex subunit ScpB [Firmicutes bacterium]|nr:SMC-Scp complex subunit ScpB [Bacillota bacterium]